MDLGQQGLKTSKINHRIQGTLSLMSENGFSSHVTLSEGLSKSKVKSSGYESTFSRSMRQSY